MRGCRIYWRSCSVELRASEVKCGLAPRGLSSTTAAEAAGVSLVPLLTAHNLQRYVPWESPRGNKSWLVRPSVTPASQVLPGARAVDTAVITKACDEGVSLGTGQGF